MRASLADLIDESDICLGGADTTSSRFAPDQFLDLPLNMVLISAALQVLVIASTLWADDVRAHSDDLGSPIPVERESLPAQYFPELNSERVKINYGFVDVPPMHKDGGMISTLVQVPIPCEDCLVTWMQAGLEYTNGSRADAGTGMWLHHTVFSTLNNPNRVCPGERYGDWFFASGNERSEMNLCEAGHTRSGYYIGHGDKMTSLTDLMNMLHHEQTVALTVTWEFIPNPPRPGPSDGITHLTPYWLDIGGCSDSNLPAKPDAHFHYSMPAKRAQIPGQVKLMVGHLHDGGSRLDVTCDGEIVCSMDAKYSTYGSEEHLSGMTSCANIGAVSPGQVWSITAHYNTMLHKPMKGHDGGLEPIMGIVIAYVAEEGPDMDDGHEGKHHHHHHHRHHHHHVMTGLLVTLAIVGSGIVVGYLWLKRRGETVMDYVPERLRRMGGTRFGSFKERIMLQGERPDASLLDQESLPAYRDEA